ncbi:hypothetical protein C0995_013020 [Termitomyces sp. Mi166|nr:hypothetical protein C0995_013020 [Termitomyces sp. Mi166\
MYQELGHSIFALLTTAREGSPQIPLSRIAHEIAQADAASLLDPLDTLPILLPCKDPGAREILSLIGECGSAKETVVAVQEALERLAAAHQNFDQDENDDPDATQRSFPSQLGILIDLYSTCIPRLTLRRKTTSETIKPLLLQLEEVIRLSGLLVSTEEASRSSVPPDWEAGEEAVSDAINAYSSLGLATDSVATQPLLSRMVIYAHAPPNTTVPIHLAKLTAVIVSSIRANCGLDEALAVLLRGLAPLKAPPRPHLSEEIIYPLFAVIPQLSSAHSDPLVRHQAFRILSLLLASCPPLVRLQLLQELTVDENFPQMRVAAVGLVREAVLEGLSNPPHLFASPRFFDVFGPILFRPNPPDLLLDQHLSFESFQKTSESARLVECLGTYYIILLRDTGNLRGDVSPGPSEIGIEQMGEIVGGRCLSKEWTKQSLSSKEHSGDIE